MNYKEFFTDLGFDFNTDLETRELSIEKDLLLTEKLKKNVFYFKSLTSTNTSFYLITNTLSNEELLRFRNYVWNKNDADLIFYFPKKGGTVKLYYAKYSPKLDLKESQLDEFSTSYLDLVKINKIRFWQFDSGAFWLNYNSLIDRSKYKGIDKELVNTLTTLKKELNNTLNGIINDYKNRDVVVQALIDRTLYIKYLEDNHIINSAFYSHYFLDETINYAKLLEEGISERINKLFSIIHSIFNNSLFDKPTIDKNFLNPSICYLISNSIKGNLNSSQLRLYDFQFNILPIELISYIYEVFLSEKQKENGIYYTPKKLAQLVIDDVICDDKIGSILDPSCGSGMFLIVGYQRLLEIAKKNGLEPNNNLEKIKFRTRLLSDNIFGIEKELTAQRFTLFSLSLQVFNEINPADIKDFIANELRENKKIDLFSECSFFENIKFANTLDMAGDPFNGKKFSYIVGNPPFFEIPNTTEYQNELIFLNTYKVALEENKETIIKYIVGKHQISQCFLVKIKDWSSNNSRYGFISNSSNFYNDISKDFQRYFYQNYGIQKIYELSRVKKILFEKAKESVLALIFDNHPKDNIIDYYPVELGVFSEKPFELLIIQEDKIVKINQGKLISNKQKLRDFLVGNNYDSALLEKMRNNKFLEEFSHAIGRGFQIWGETARRKEFNISKDEWGKLTDEAKNTFLQTFIKKYFSDEYSPTFNKAYIKPNNLSPFIKLGSNKFISSLENFERPIKNQDIYIGKKLIFTRIGSKLNCVYSDSNDYFDFSVYTFKLKDENLYYLFQAILNSSAIQYYLDFYQRKRVFDSFSRIGNDDILQIPIPRDLSTELAEDITGISRDISINKYSYTEKAEELNELIFDLFGFNYWEKQRVRDYFTPTYKLTKNIRLLENYKATVSEVLNLYLKNPVLIEITSTDFHLIVAKISLNSGTSKNPDATKVKKYILNEIFEQNPHNNLLASQEKIYGNDCVYFIKENLSKNWSETKAFEDGQDILQHLIPNSYGERVH